ncbi:MAG: TolC family protein [Chthoniobacterales bacterium]
MKLTRFAAFGLCGLLVSGCALNPAPAYRDVEESVSRASGKRIRWIRSGQEQAEATRAVRALLSRPLNADTAAQVALLNNRHLQSRLETFGISYADYIEASLPENPKFSASFRFPDRPPSATNIEYSVAQNIVSLLLIPLKKAVAKRELEMTKLRIAADILGLVARTKTAFYRLQAQEQLRSRLELIVQSNEASADLAKRLHDAGNINDLDLANQQALYSQSRVEVGQLLAQTRSSREEMNRLLGLWGAETNWQVGHQLPTIPGREVSLANLESKAIAQRVDIAAARARVNSVGTALALKQKTRFTPVDIELGINTEKEVEGERLTGPTIDVQLPIFNLGQATIARLEAHYAQAKRDLEAAAIDARSEVRQARDLIIANRDMAEYYRKILLPQRLLILNQTQLQYNAMQTGPIELLSAKQRQLETERAYVNAWRDYWIARAELERALHGGTGGGMPQMSEDSSASSEAPQGGH